MTRRTDSRLFTGRPTRPPSRDDEPVPGRSDATARPASRPRRGLILAALLIGGVLVGTWLYLRDPGQRPVVETTLQTGGVMRFLSGGRNWRNLPFDLDSAEREDLATCLRVAADVRTTTNGVSAFADPNVREQLEAVLARRPDYFYAESLLALWYAMNGDPGRSREYYDRSLAHAPVVLVQRYEFADGKPLVDAKIETFQVECNRVKNGSLNPSLRLTFFDLETDADGEIVVPVYDTVYRLFNTSHPEGYTAIYPRLGWFESKGRVGVLPPAKVRPKTED